MSLALCLWSVYLWNIAAPGVRDRAGKLKGTDFSALPRYRLGPFWFTAARIALIPITALGF